MVPIGLLRPIKDYLRRSGRIELAELVKLVDQAELCHHDTHVHKKGAQKNLRDQALEIIAQVSDAPPPPSWFQLGAIQFSLIHTAARSFPTAWLALRISSGS